MSGLCIACCSTLRKGTQESYTTTCCSRQICESCIRANPRLKEYSPCLACGGGVQVVVSSGRTAGSYKSPRTEQFEREANAFVVGGDSDDDDQESPPEPQPVGSSPTTDLEEKSKEIEETPSQANALEQGGPRKYWLQKRDTLQGIALRYKLNSREICKLNGLPPSTLSTTPHLLHTRPFIILPQTEEQLPPPPPDAEEREENRKRERAAKQFQFVTKEIDWGIAKAYVAISEVNDTDHEYAMKRKEMGQPAVGGSSAAKASDAVDLYMDDDGWERDQLKAGLKPRILPIPFFAMKS